MDKDVNLREKSFVQDWKAHTHTNIFERQYMTYYYYYYNTEPRNT